MKDDTGESCITLREKCPYSELFWCGCGKMQTRITPDTDTFYAVSGELNKYPLTINSKSSNHSRIATSTFVNKLKSFMETKIPPVPLKSYFEVTELELSHCTENGVFHE